MLPVSGPSARVLAGASAIADGSLSNSGVALQSPLPYSYLPSGGAAAFNGAPSHVGTGSAARGAAAAASTASLPAPRLILKSPLAPVRRGGLFPTFSSRQALLAPSASSAASLRSSHQSGRRAITPGRLHAGPPPLYASVSEPVLDHDAACGVAADADTGPFADAAPSALRDPERAPAAPSHAASAGQLPNSRSLLRSKSPVAHALQPAAFVATRRGVDGIALTAPAGGDDSRLQSTTSVSRPGKGQLRPLPGTAPTEGTRPRSAGVVGRPSVGNARLDASALLRAVRRSPSTRRLAASTGTLVHASHILSPEGAHAAGAAGDAAAAAVGAVDAPSAFADLAPPLHWEVPRVDLLSHRLLSADTPSIHRRAEHAATRQAQLNERSGRSHATLPHVPGSGGSSTQSLGTMGPRAASLRHASPQRLRAYTLRREADEPMGSAAAPSSSPKLRRSAGSTPELPPLRFGGARVAAGESNSADSGHIAGNGDDANTARVYADADTGVAASTGRTDGTSDSARSTSQRRLSLTMALQVKRMARRWSNVPKVRACRDGREGYRASSVLSLAGLGALRLLDNASCNLSVNAAFPGHAVVSHSPRSVIYPASALW